MQTAHTTCARVPSSLLASPEGIGDASAAFHRDGCVVLEQAIIPAELAALRAQTAELIERAPIDHREDIDYFFTGAGALHRIQYIFSKGPALLSLLAHPEILALVRALLGEECFCSGEALVLKAPGDGAEVPIHRDCAPDAPALPLAHVAFNVDVYIDDATPENGCLEVVPGSHAVDIPGAEIGAHGFDWPNLVPVPVRAGDVIIHHLRVLHGSRRSRHPSLRRTLYYEFHRRADVRADGLRSNVKVGSAWIDNRLRILDHAVRRRRATPWGAAERRSDHRLPADVAPADIDFRPRLGLNKYA